MAASFTLVLALLRDFGTGTAAIQAPELSAGQQTALLQLHAGLGVVLAALTLVAAPAVAGFYQEQSVQLLLYAMSANFVLNGLNAWPRTLLGRQLRFRETNRIELAGALAGTTAMIGAAAAGAGALAFVWFMLVSEFAMAVEAWRLAGWRPSAPADWAALRPLVRTGWQVTASGLLGQIVAQLDAAAMGRWFGAAPLGCYNRATQLLLQPALLVATPFTQVLLASLSRLRGEPASFSRHLRDSANLIAHLTLPFAAVCVAAPEYVVLVALGSSWPDAAPLLRWLGVAAASTLLAATLPAVCIATGQARRHTEVCFATLLVLLAALWFGRASGPVGLAAAVAVAQAGLLPIKVWWATRGLPVGWVDYVAALRGPVLQSLALGAAVAAARALAPSTGLRAVALALAAGAVSYAAVALGRTEGRDELRRIRGLLGGHAFPTRR